MVPLVVADEWQRVEAISVCIYTAAFVLSFLFLFYQLKGLQRQTRSNTVQGYWDTWIEIDRWFVQNSHLRPYFYHGKDLDGTESKELLAQLEATAEMFLDLFASAYFQRHELPDDQMEAERYFASKMYREQPVFRRYAIDNADWYRPAFFHYLMTGPSSLNRTPPALPK